MRSIAERILAAKGGIGKPYQPAKPKDMHWQAREQNKRKGKYRYAGGEELPEGVFKGSPSSIAQTLKTKCEDCKQAISRISFYMNSSGKNLSSADRNRLNLAKDAVYRSYGEVPPAERT
jgi:hypothetical protein